MKIYNEKEFIDYDYLTEPEKKKYRKHLYDTDRGKFFRLWRYNHPEESNERHKRYEKRNKIKRHKYYVENGVEVFNRRLKRYFGITVDDYYDMVKKQGNRCAICGKNETSQAYNRFKNKKTIKRLSVDHDHDTGHIRGLLCSRCNSMLGNVYDDPKILKKCVEYIIEEDYKDERMEDVLYGGYYGKEIKPDFRINHESRVRRTKQFYTLLEEQLSGCSICNKTIVPKKHAIDHNHLTGKVRKLLCFNCNSALGFVYEDIRIFEAAIKYLEKHRKSRPEGVGPVPPSVRRKRSRKSSKNNLS